MRSTKMAESRFAQARKTIEIEKEIKKNPYSKGTKEAEKSFHRTLEKEITKPKSRKSKKTDLVKAFGFSLQQSIGEKIKEEAKNTPLSASGLLNDFLEKEFDNYLEKYWNK